MPKDHICALDIGSSKVSAAVAEFKRKRIQRLFLNSAPAEGLEKGSIIDAHSFTEGISSVLKQLKYISGINIKSVRVGVSGQNIVTRHSRAVIPLSERGNKVITLSDIHKVIEQAQALGSSLDEEIIHRIPFGYNIDSKSNILNPLGLYSHRLEVDLYLICLKSASLKTLTRLFNQAGYDMLDLFLAGIATAGAIFDKQLKQGLNILCDIGCAITEVLLFKDGLLQEMEILDCGGADLTKQLSEELNIPLELAEEVKKSYGSVGEPDLISQDKEILLKKNNNYLSLSQRLVCGIVTAKTRWVCQNIKQAAQRMVNLNAVNNFMVAGRTVLLEGFMETLEGTLGITARLAKITHPQLASLTNTQRELSGNKYFTYLTCLGLICQALSQEEPEFACLPQTHSHRFLKAIQRAKEIYEEYF